MTTLTESLDEYLRLRRNLGYQLADAARLLPRFVAWMDVNEQPTVTIATTIAWVETVSADLDSTVWPRRMTAVRGFARYLSGIDSATEVPPIGLFPSRRRWRAPFIYSADDITALMKHGQRYPTGTLVTLSGVVRANAGVVASTCPRHGHRSKPLPTATSRPR